MQPLPPRETIADGKYVRLVRQGKWEFASRKKVSGIVGVVALTDDGRLVLIEQFRMPVGKPVIEIPAGLAGDAAGLEEEKLEAAAARELHEETGYEAAELRLVAEGPPSAGMSDELIALFVATGLKKTGDGAGDGSEQITLHEVPLGDVPAWLDRQRAAGKMIDLKVYAGLYFAQAAR
jgi:ADP-ribose pyrophosphatase